MPEPPDRDEEGDGARWAQGEQAGAPTPDGHEAGDAPGPVAAPVPDPGADPIGLTPEPEDVNPDTVVTAYGGDAVRGAKVENHGNGSVTTNIFSGHPPPGARHEYGANVQPLLAHYVAPTTHAALKSALSERHLVVVRGRPGTGRKLCAFAVLDELADSVGEITGRHGLQCVEVESLKDRHGYVMDATYAPWAGRLDFITYQRLEARLKEHGCRLVVLVGLHTIVDPEVDAVPYEPAEPKDVLHGHLAGDRAAAYAAELTDADLPARPRLLAGIARTLYTSSETEPPAARRLRWLTEAVRSRFIKPEEMTGKDWAGYRSFLIAWAVLDLVPAATVCAEAASLVQAVHATENPEKSMRRGPLDEQLGRWLDFVSEIDGAEDHILASDPHKQRLALRQPVLSLAVLDVTWREYTVARGPLLRWLNELISSRDVDVRYRCARAFGRFAAHDFDYVYKEYLSEWSMSPYVAHHRALAWALEAALDGNPDLRKKIGDLLYDWSRGSIERKSAAIRVYGTQIGVDDVDRALRTFKRITEQHEGTLRDEIPHVVGDLFQSGARAEVIDALTGWARSTVPALRRTAALSVVDLARRATAIGSNLPDLLRFCDGSLARADAVAELWRAVLTSQAGGQQPWERLRAWQRKHASSPALLALISRLETDAVLGPRIRFNLGFRPQEETR